MATFIAGYAVIVLEEQTEINKAATALVLGAPRWDRNDPRGTVGPEAGPGPGANVGPRTGEMAERVGSLGRARRMH